MLEVSRWDKPYAEHEEQELYFLGLLFRGRADEEEVWVWLYTNPWGLDSSPVGGHRPLTRGTSFAGHSRVTACYTNSSRAHMLTVLSATSPKLGGTFERSAGLDPGSAGLKDTWR